MAYSVVSKKSGKTYHLHVRITKRKDGKETRLYFFAGTVKDEGACDELPEGYEVIESPATGLPFLKRKAS
jgi:hypothetical protein